MLRSLPIALLSLAAITPSGLNAQRAAGPPTVTVSAEIGGKSYEGTGPGRCRHTPEASIYDVPAALYMVEQGGATNGAIKNLHLTVWKPKDGSRDQVSLSLTTRAGSHRIDTGGRGKQIGRGTAAVVAAGSGGRIEVKGQDEAGAAVELVITCPSFAGVEAEGG